MEYFSDQIDTYDDHANDIKPNNPFQKSKQLNEINSNM